MVTIFSRVVKTMIPEVNLSKNFITKNGICIMNDLIILQVHSLLHLLIFPSVIHHRVFILIDLYVKTNTIVITSLSSLNRTLFPLRTTIQSDNLIEPTGIYLILCALVRLIDTRKLLILPLLLLKYLKNVFLKLPQIQLKVVHGTMTTV